MPVNPYKKYAKEDLILRDHLALDRTYLANERSLLAYIRTGIAIFLAGVSLLKLFSEFLSHLFGWILIIISVIVVGIGILRTRKTHAFISEIKQTTNKRHAILENSQRKVLQNIQEFDED